MFSARYAQKPEKGSLWGTTCVEGIIQGWPDRVDSDPHRSNSHAINLILMDSCIVDYSVEIPTRCSPIIEFIIPYFFSKAQHVSSGTPLIIRSSKLYLQPLVYMPIWWPAVAKTEWALVPCLTLRRLMSYIYGAPILDVSRSHTTTQHSR